MFERFLARYRVAARVDGSPLRPPAALGPVPGFGEFMEQFCGASFNDGIYRVHTAETSQAIFPHVFEEFPSYRDRITCFGFDWIGRQFALDAARQEGGEPLVLMFEADTGDALEIPATFAQFHDSELVDYPDDALVANYFEEWRRYSRRSAPLSHDECAGFKVPLFLGGKKTVDNMEVTNIQVHWSLSAQLWRGTRRMAPGTPIRGVEIGPDD